MAAPVAPQHRAVVVERERADEHLVAPVAVHVLAQAGVVALPLEPARHELVVELPHALQRRPREAVGVDDHLAVRAALHDHAGRLAVEVREGDLVAGVVVVVVAGGVGRGARDPRRLGADAPRQAVEHGEVFGTVRHAPVGVAVVGREGRRLRDDLRPAVAVEVGDDERRVPDAHLDVPAEVHAPEAVPL